MKIPKRNKMELFLTLTIVLSFIMALAPGSVISVLAQTTTVSAPTFSPPAGTYTSAQTIALSSATPSVAIRYTLDGSEPNTATSPLYQMPIVISSSVTIKAKAYLAIVSGMYESETVSATYTINLAPVEKVATPTFSPSGGTYSTAQSVVIQCATSGATIRYSTTGDEPTSSSTAYSAPISVNTNTTIKAKAFASGMTDSDTATATYNIVEETNNPTNPIGIEVYIAIAVIAIIVVVAGVALYLRARKKPSA